MTERLGTVRQTDDLTQDANCFTAWETPFPYLCAVCQGMLQII